MFIDIPASSSQSATQRVYLQLRRDIISGMLPPGERLKVETLKTRLDTGASPVREALSLLTSDQLVERLDQKGFRVAAASREQFDEILKLRCTLEDLALRESIAEGSDSWESTVVLAHHHLRKCDRADAERHENAHRQFHMALIGACRSPILLKFCAQLYDLNVRYRFLAGRQKSYAARDIDMEHLSIMEATVARDAESASTELREHYSKTGAFLSEMLS